MSAPFDPIWQELITRLKPGMIIRNWTALKGYLGDTIRVAEVKDIEIVIQAPKAKNLQHISREEFGKVWEVWRAYKSGRFQRQNIREMTFYSKYIISILHWLDEANK